MLKRFASIGLVLIFATAAPAQEADDADAQLSSRAVMTSEQVVQILDETVDWYRMLGIQQQSATQPSDLLILYANGKIADGVVKLFDLTVESQYSYWFVCRPRALSQRPVKLFHDWLIEALGAEAQ